MAGETQTQFFGLRVSEFGIHLMLLPLEYTDTSHTYYLGTHILETITYVCILAVNNFLRSTITTFRSRRQSKLLNSTFKSSYNCRQSRVAVAFAIQYISRHPFPDFSPVLLRENSFYDRLNFSYD